MKIAILAFILAMAIKMIKHIKRCEIKSLIY